MYKMFPRLSTCLTHSHSFSLGVLLKRKASVLRSSSWKPMPYTSGGSASTASHSDNPTVGDPPFTFQVPTNTLKSKESNFSVFIHWKTLTMQNIPSAIYFCRLANMEQCHFNVCSYSHTRIRDWFWYFTNSMYHYIVTCLGYRWAPGHL